MLLCHDGQTQGCKGMRAALQGSWRGMKAQTGAPLPGRQSYDSGNRQHLLHPRIISLRQACSCNSVLIYHPLLALTCDAARELLQPKLSMRRHSILWVSPEGRSR